MATTNSQDLIGAGQTALRQGRFAEAEHWLGLALQTAPATAELTFLYGTALAQTGKRAEAVRFLTAALSAAPNDLAIVNNLAAVLRQSGRLDEAERHLRRGLALHPKSPDLLASTGQVLRAQGRSDQAAECANLALKFAPDHAEALVLAGLVLRDHGRPSDAVAYFARAVAARPERAALHVALAEALFAAGRLADGASEYERRWQQTPMPELPAPLWDGGALGQDKTLLLWSDGTASEALRLVRLAYSLHARVGRVVVAAPATLLALLASAPGVDAVVSFGDPFPPFDAHLPIGSLPHRLGLRDDTVPAVTPYLAADSARADRYGALLAGGGFKVGLAWSGDSGLRAPSLAELAPLFAIPNVRFFALDSAAPSAAKAEPADRLVDLSGCLADYADAAAVIGQLDLVIAADGPIAHVTGALNRPGWVMLGRDAHWRWLAGRTDSPWYPSLLLFREAGAGWSGVAQEVANSLTLFGASAQPMPTVDPARAGAYAPFFASGGLKIGLALDGETPLLSDLAPILSRPGLRFYALDRRASIQAARNTYGAQLGDFAIAESSPADAAAIVSHLDLVIAGDNALATTAAALGIPAWIVLPADAPPPRAQGTATWLFRRAFGTDWTGVVEQMDQALVIAGARPQAQAG
ncbi:MAG: tetratricopeptide repeat protein [Alphaproteobacteria bacterium]|nr:tetratricopeptide repeat protein [Alphaproteobacteria bacterium]